MTKLEDLLYSLTTVLIRYHDCQTGIKPLILENDVTLLRSKSRTYAINILQDKDYISRLEDLIKTCTKGYPARTPFLFYLLNEIKFLKTLQDRKNSFEPDKLEEYKNQLSQLFVDLKRLLNTLKDETYEVKYSRLNAESENSKVTIALSGLTQNAYFGKKPCRSGDLIKEEVLDTLNISSTYSQKEIDSRNYSDSEIKIIANSICIEHQNALLVPELQAKFAVLEVEYAKSSAVQAKQQELLDGLNSRSIEQQDQIKSKDETIANLRVRVSDLTHAAPAPNPIAAAFNPGGFFMNRYGIPRAGGYQASSSSASTPPTEKPNKN